MENTRQLTKSFGDYSLNRGWKAPFEEPARYWLKSINLNAHVEHMFFRFAPKIVGVEECGRVLVGLSAFG